MSKSFNTTAVCINQVFLDFLSQLRAGYIDRDLEPTFKSVILAGVYDIKNLLKLSYKPKTGGVISMYLSCLLFSH